MIMKQVGEPVTSVKEKSNNKIVWVDNTVEIWEKQTISHVFVDALLHQLPVNE